VGGDGEGRCPSLQGDHGPFPFSSGPGAAQEGQGLEQEEHTSGASPSTPVNLMAGTGLEGVLLTLCSDAAPGFENHSLDLENPSEGSGSGVSDRKPPFARPCSKCFRCLNTVNPQMTSHHAIIEETGKR
jgi:hypothetical protein